MRTKQQIDYYKTPCEEGGYYFGYTYLCTNGKKWKEVWLRRNDKLLSKQVLPVKI